MSNVSRFDSRNGHGGENFRIETRNSKPKISDLGGTYLTPFCEHFWLAGGHFSGGGLEDMKDSGDAGEVEVPASSRSLNSKRVSVVSEDSEPVPPLIPPSAVERGTRTT